ncbi:hypothetical protein JCM14469_42180 [Desulfatiferula olefinivorans]
MTEQEIRDFLSMVGDDEILLFALFEGDKEVPDGMAGLWHPKSLEILTAMELISWTGDTYVLSRDGHAIARFINDNDGADVVYGKSSAKFWKKFSGSLNEG